MNNTLNEEAMKIAEEMLSNPDVQEAFANAKPFGTKVEPTDKESLIVEEAFNEDDYEPYLGNAIDSIEVLLSKADEESEQVLELKHRQNLKALEK